MKTLPFPDNEPYVRVGIYTDSSPIMESSGNMTVLHNQIIGKGFHWEQKIKTILPGDFIPYSGKESGIELINILPLETYLKCVIGSEMNSNAPIEFLKAHAVISRSWALNVLTHTRYSYTNEKIISENMIITWEDNCDHEGFDFCSDDHCQRYQGIPDNDNAARAVDMTRGIILSDPEGDIIDTRYSKCCGGMTELFSSCWSSDNPATLKAFPDPYCNLSTMNEYRRTKLLATAFKSYDRNMSDHGGWKIDISKDIISRNLKNRYNRDLGNIIDIEILERGASGRAVMIRINGDTGSLIMGKELTIRRVLSETCLYSSAINIENKGDYFTIHGWGWGHGVGLCQTGAARMAADGAQFEDILSFYYKGSKLRQIY